MKQPPSRISKFVRIPGDNKQAGVRLLELRAKQSGLSDNALRLLEVGSAEKMNRLFEAANSRVDPRVGRKRKHAEYCDTRTRTSFKNTSTFTSRAVTRSSLRVRTSPKRSKCVHYDSASVCCAMIHCGKDCTGSSRRAPPLPPEPKPVRNGEAIPIRRLQTYARKRFKRHEFLRRCGLKYNDSRKHLRICCCHPMEAAVKKYFTYKSPDGDKSMSWVFKNCLPEEAGPKSNRPGLNKAQASKRVGRDPRFLANYVEEVSRQPTMTDGCSRCNSSPAGQILVIRRIHLSLVMAAG